ncbi:MAG TPA: TetR/AcrR family transcriptional regulator [Ktedonobacterales bacterium]|jgi:AcrR family transcriptional regulator|nr:TetR/AcrR family transcriptional regulator [Ktedonobacterales bacterium]
MDTKQDRTKAKQAQILVAAARLFQERGFEGTSTDAIAASAGVSKETLYRHYPSKEQLLVAVLRAIAVEGVFTDSLPQLPSDATRETLERILRSLADTILDRLLTREYAALARLVIAESGRHPQLVGLFQGRVIEVGAESLRNLLEAAQQRGLIRGDVDLAAARQLFIGPLLAWALARALLAGNEEPKRPTAEEVLQLVRLFLDGVAGRA